MRHRANCSRAIGSPSIQFLSSVSTVYPVLTHRGLPRMFAEHNQGWTQILRQQEISLVG
jgi:hypothetical protein